MFFFVQTFSWKLFLFLHTFNDRLEMLRDELGFLRIRIEDFDRVEEGRNSSDKIGLKILDEHLLERLSFDVSKRKSIGAKRAWVSLLELLVSLHNLWQVFLDHVSFVGKITFDLQVIQVVRLLLKIPLQQLVHRYFCCFLVSKAIVSFH